MMPWFYLYLMLYIVANYCMQIQGKLMYQTWENGKKPSFGTKFGPFDSNLDHKIVFVPFTSTRC